MFIWDFLDKERVKAEERQDWSIVYKILLQKAMYYRDTGKDSFPVHQESFKYRLKELQAKGVSHVRIIAARTGRFVISVPVKTRRCFQLKKPWEKCRSLFNAIAAGAALYY
jgi:hypothetical protein